MPDLFGDLPTKRCTRCRKHKPLSAFYGQYHKVYRRLYRHSYCRACCADIRRAKYATGVGKRTIKSNALKRKYGITLAEYEQLHAAQQGLCAICGKPETAMRYGKVLVLAVDHAHGTGCRRALLCGRCNKGIGCFLDDPKLLRAAAAYLEQHTD